MAPVVTIQLVFLLLYVLQIQTSAVTPDGFLLLLCPETRCPCSAASCLKRGPTTNRNDYTYVPGIGGYKVHSQVANWNTARKTCEQEGGYLAIINSVAESKFIKKLFLNSLPHPGSSDSDFVHVGFHDLYKEGEFVTIHGESVENTGFNDWSHSGPNDDGGGEDCGSIYVDGRLNDISCQKSCGFVCELP